METITNSQIVEDVEFLNSLTSKTRDVVKLYAMHKTFTEIAQVIGMSSVNEVIETIWSAFTAVDLMNHFSTVDQYSVTGALTTKGLDIMTSFVTINSIETLSTMYNVSPYVMSIFTEFVRTISLQNMMNSVRKETV